MVKSHKKKCQKYFPVIKITANDMMKCRCVKQKKMMDFDYCEEYLKTVYQKKQNIIMAASRKALSHSVLVCKLVRKSIL